MKKIFLFMLALWLHNSNATAQCIGDQIAQYVNSDSAIQGTVKSVFKLRKCRISNIINVDTSMIYLDDYYRSFKDTLIKSGYSKRTVDTLCTYFLKLPDSLFGNAPQFCQTHFISTEDNYNERKYNLILEISQYNDSFVIGEIIYCTGPYYYSKISNPQSEEHVFLMFFFNNKGDIERVISKRIKYFLDAPVYH
ncbi:hypothetical protein BH09BAC5_BH09BAC5_12540 [soil metagenome]